MAKSAEGPSASLNQTITEIMKHLGDDGPRPGGKGAKLRPFLRKKIGDLCERWFKRGFNRGHRESFKYFEAGEPVPRKLEYECSRKLSPGQDRDLSLKSTIKKKPKKSESAARKKRP